MWLFTRHQNRLASDGHVQTAAMPMWSRNRGELFLLADSRRNLLMSVTVDDSGGAPRAGTPHLIVEQSMGGGC
jgi:hypothetical protein